MTKKINRRHHAVTLLDALSTLWLMELKTEFRQGFLTFFRVFLLKSF